MKSSSLWFIYSILRSTISVNNDIESSNTKIAYLKHQAVGYKPIRLIALNFDEIITFATEAPDEIYLL